MKLLLKVIKYIVLLSFLITDTLYALEKPLKKGVLNEPAMVFIKGGDFQMGSPETEKDRNNDESLHSVHVDDFYMGRYEVTVTEYEQCVIEKAGCNPPQWIESNHPAYYDKMRQTAKHPIVGITWDDAMHYAKWLSLKTGKRYQLPTEAQWEYAARNHTTTAYPWGETLDEAKANCDNAICKDTFDFTAPVGQFPPVNGLYDMSGNAWEWTCSDYVENYDGSEKRCSEGQNPEASKVLRGGSWFNNAWSLRSAYRFRNIPAHRYGGIGFRLIRF